MSGLNSSRVATFFQKLSSSSSCYGSSNMRMKIPLSVIVEKEKSHWHKKRLSQTLSAPAYTLWENKVTNFLPLDKDASWALEKENVKNSLDFSSSSFCFCCCCCLPCASRRYELDVESSCSTGWCLLRFLVHSARDCLKESIKNRQMLFDHHNIVDVGWVGSTRRQRLDENTFVVFSFL